MRILAIALISFCLARHADAVVRSNHPYRREYARQTYGKHALIGAGAGATVGHIRNHPRQWGRGPAGFGKRVASGLGTHVVKNTIQYGVAGARHEELGYHRSHKHGFGPRLKHALVSTVVTRKKTTGKHTVAAGRISGAVGSGVISQTWQPAAMHSVGGGVATGGISLGADAAANVAREFWPRKKHSHHSSRRPA